MYTYIRTHNHTQSRTITRSLSLSDIPPLSVSAPAPARSNGRHHVRCSSCTVLSGDDPNQCSYRQYGTSLERSYWGIGSYNGLCCRCAKRKGWQKFDRDACSQCKSRAWQDENSPPTQPQPAGQGGPQTGPWGPRPDNAFGRSPYPVGLAGQPIARF